MRKHIDYHYKCYDKQNETNMDKMIYESFNEYGYNFESNSKKNIDYDDLIAKKHYNTCVNRVKEMKH